MTIDVSRRGFFAAGARRVASAVTDVVTRAAGGAAPQVAPRGPALLRPPGALPEPQFLDTCTRCDACVAACPRHSIRKAGAELGDAVAGTPVLVPATDPCWLCADLPCITACEAGALAPLADRFAVRMGIARVDAGRCFAAAGSICESCQERCPVRPRAIHVAFGAAPEVLADRCTGCGVCAYLCPAGAVTIDSPDRPTAEPMTIRASR